MCGSELKKCLVFVGLIISLQLFRGDMEQIRRENPMIFNRGLAITRKLGFPDVIMPGKKNCLGMGREWISRREFRARCLSRWWARQVSRTAIRVKQLAVVFPVVLWALESICSLPEAPASWPPSATWQCSRWALWSSGDKRTTWNCFIEMFL